MNETYCPKCGSLDLHKATRVPNNACEQCGCEQCGCVWRPAPGAPFLPPISTLPTRCRWDCTDPCFEHQPQQLSEQATRISTALVELAEAGSNLCVLLDAISNGARLTLGPQRSPVDLEPRRGLWIGTLERDQDALTSEGSDLLRVVNELAERWIQR